MILQRKEPEGLMTRKRNEIPEEAAWRLEDMIENQETWERLYEEVSREADRYQEFKGTLGQSAQRLLEGLKFDDDISQKIERLYVYARMRSDEDTAGQQYQDMVSRAQSLSVRAAELSSYMVPEILAIPDEQMDAFRKSGNGLVLYDRLLSQLIKRKDHTLSDEMEALLAAAQDATQGGSQVFRMFNNADVRFPSIRGTDGREISVTHGTYISLMEHPDRRIRREAFQSLYGVYRQYSNTLASAFGANVKQAVFYAKARKYSSSREYFLSANEVPEAVYDRLISSVRKGLPVLHRYISLRKKLLKLNELHMYDVYVPLVSEADKHYTFEEAKKMVKEGLAPMGKEYLSLLEEGFGNRWIDVYENEGKRSGAYSWGIYGCHPYVLLNFHGTLKDVFTLAHEMGHAIHTWYSNESQPYIYAGYKIFVAEVASTCNEALLIRHLLGKCTDKKERAYLLNHFLESFRTTLFRQTMFAEFEQKVHEMGASGESLTSEALCGIYGKLNEDYFGPDMVSDPEISYEWERIPHFYTPFYVYQYATGFSAAIAISRRIMEGEPGILEGYKRFLSGGCSMEPVELLKLCGVDMSQSRPIEQALEFFEELLDEFEVCMK